MSRKSAYFSRIPIITMLAIAAVVVAVVGLLSYQSSLSRRAAASELNVSRQVRDTTDELLSLLKDAETGQRGYLLTGRESYLGPYRTATGAIPEVLGRLRSATAGLNDQRDRVAALEPVIAAKLQELATTIDLRRSRGQTPALEVVDSDRGKALMDDIRARCSVIRDAADRRANEFSAIAEQSSTRVGFVSVFGSLLLLACLVLSAATVFRGLAQREQLYHQSAAHAEFLRVTLTSIGDAVIATDADARITLINPVARDLTGWSEEEALGSSISNVFRIVNETTREPVENPVKKAIASGVVTALANHTTLISKTGAEIPIDDSGAPIRGSDGSILGGILVFRDISARYRSERQLKESNEQLKEFVGAAAHDLRSPLNSVSTMAQLIALRFQDQIGAEGSELLGYIRHGTERMLRLLEDLLSYAQASHFERNAANRASMERALQTALENLRAEIESARATITSDGLPDVRAHEAHLVQLFQNLVGNAVKYRSETAPNVRIACAHHNGECVVQVIDNGIGIEAQFEKHIFKPFKRLHGDELPGSGIGLATCQKIVNGYGGRIWVESQPGKGSTFFFSLPLADDAVAKSVG